MQYNYCVVQLICNTAISQHQFYAYSIITKNKAYFEYRQNYEKQSFDWKITNISFCDISKITEARCFKSAKRGLRWLMLGRKSMLQATNLSGLA